MWLDRNDTTFFSVPLAHVPLLDLLSPLRAAGFTSLTLTFGHIDALLRQGMSPREIRTRIAQAGLKVAGFESIASWLPGQTHCSWLPPDIVKGLSHLTADLVLPLAAELEAGCVTIAELFGVSLPPAQIADAFGAICDQAASHGLKLGLEFIPAGAIPNLDAALDILAQAGRENGGLIVDSLHFFRGHNRLETLRSVPADKIFGVQLADAPLHPAAGLEEEITRARMTPGQGKLPLRAFVQTLDEIGVSAPVGVEVFAPEILTDPPATTARNWMAGLRAVLTPPPAGAQ